MKKNKHAILIWPTNYTLKIFSQKSEDFCPYKNMYMNILVTVFVKSKAVNNPKGLHWVNG